MSRQPPNHGRWIRGLFARLPAQRSDRHDDWLRLVIPIRNHIAELHEGYDGWSVGVAFDDQASRMRRVLWSRADQSAQLDDMADQLARFNLQGFSVHLCIGLRQESLPGGRRGGREDVKCLPALWTEIDGGDPRVLYNDWLPEPTWVLRTSLREGGGGYQAYWLLREPTDQLEMAERVMQEITGRVHGDAAITAVDRNMRLAGSINRKPSRNNERVILWNRPTTVRYQFEDFIHLDPGPPVPFAPSEDFQRWRDERERNPGFVSADELVLRLAGTGKARPTRTRIREIQGHLVRCPAHHDPTPSLFIGTGTDGETVIHCFGTGCTRESVLRALGLGASDLYPTRRVNPKRDPNRAWQVARQHRRRR